MTKTNKPARRNTDSDELQEAMAAVMKTRAVVVAMAGAVVDAKRMKLSSLDALIEELGEFLEQEKVQRKAFAELAEKVKSEE